MSINLFSVALSRNSGSKDKAGNSTEGSIWFRVDKGNERTGGGHDFPSTDRSFISSKQTECLDAQSNQPSSTMIHDHQMPVPSLLLQPELSRALIESLQKTFWVRKTTNSPPSRMDTQIQASKDLLLDQRVKYRYFRYYPHTLVLLLMTRLTSMPSQSKSWRNTNITTI